MTVIKKYGRMFRGEAKVFKDRRRTYAKSTGKKTSNDAKKNISS